MLEELTTIEELEAYLRVLDEDLYKGVATDLYLLLRQHVRDPWRHGLSLDAIDINTREYLNVGRHRALFDRGWVFDEKVDAETWHVTMVRVLEWIGRGDNRAEGIAYRLLDDEPGVGQWLRHFTVNTRREAWRDHEDPEGGFEGSVDDETNEEVPPPKGFQPPEPHSWRRQFLTHDPWIGLDLEIDVKRALATLPRVDCALFVRHHAYGATFQSLADGIPLGTVKSKLTASMQKVRDFLNEIPPKKRGRPPKNNLINSHPIDPISRLSRYTPTTRRGVADALSHQQNGAGPAACTAPRIETREEDKQWPGWSLSADDSWQRKVLKWRKEGAHGQKLVWRDLRHGTIRESWTRHSVMRAFF